MTKNLYFKINNLKNVFFLGGVSYFDKLYKINSKIGLKTFIVTSPHQAKELNLKKIKVFKSIDSNFLKYVTNKVKIDDTIFVSLGSRWIFKKKNIEKFKNNLVNFHWGRLPFDTGGAPTSWKILRQDRLDNQLVHHVDEGIDTGPILDNQLSVIPRNCILPFEIEKFREKKFLTFYENFIKKIKSKQNVTKKIQPNYIGSYNTRLNTNINGWIDWSYNSYDLLNFINAFEEPFEGASTTIRNKLVRIMGVQIHGSEPSNHPFAAGLILRHDQKWIIVSTKDKNCLIIEKVINSSGKNIIEYLKPGDRFFTPLKNIENLKEKRILYGPNGFKY
tara:strand:+ start:253 stop:1248 length:996 start_codon:yes stop_codon:yes gene_type:complete